MSKEDTVEVTPFQREERYIVIKRRHLSERQEDEVRRMLAAEEIDTVECVVVESDWPEYETVWKMIEARVTGRPTPAGDAGLVSKALAFAATAHASINQTRKYTGEPYIVHPIEVMMLVRQHGGTDEMQAAALLHDVVEDTPVTLNEIEHEFGMVVATFVESLTDSETGNRAARKSAARARLAASSPEVQTIKLADLISNTRTIVERDPKFAKVYMAEKAALLEVLTEGSRALRSMATDMVLSYQAALNPAAQAPEAGEAVVAPIPMLLFCPKCHVQHIDAPDERTPDWENPPHRSHLCHNCGCIWRPADVATEGVEAIETIGKADTWSADDPPATPEQS